MHLVIFEDSDWHAFAPLSLSRPVFSLASGMTNLLRKQIRHVKPTRVTLWVRPELANWCRERIAPEVGVPAQVNVALDSQPALLLNGRTALSSPVEIPPAQAVATAENGTILAVKLTQPNLGPGDVLGKTARWLSALQLPAMTSPGKLLHSPVDLIYWNEQSLAEDFAHLEASHYPTPPGPYHLVNEADIRVAPDAILSAGCVLDASKGPIAIAQGATVGFNAVVQGPCWVGPGAVVTPLANIRPGTSIGAMCKVGGEVSATVFLGYCNKSHEGFVGHSYIGKWVNLGAGTTTSNLKNTYGPISLKRGNREIATGRRFLGALIGDHTKTAILTRFMGGSYVGYCAMISTSAAAPRFVPSYTFLTDQGAAAYDHEKAVEVAQRVFTRRDRVWTDTDEQIMNSVRETAPAIEV
ncbi:MAG TPA: putative sugar nucleotidyl transferase [Tepidisphaeraceae bacterium]|jgi:UDP-N-acetylglucosamine diphosphorylase/glucosamine-1-phosphate N-acetyltransferase|nr:putative sugar nucleotidyl transferase [Tepidisphaeraceae bacterium]